MTPMVIALNAILVLSVVTGVIRLTVKSFAQNAVIDAAGTARTTNPTAQIATVRNL